MKRITAAQREVLTDAAAAPYGEISRWNVDGSRLRTLTTLVRDGRLEALHQGWYRITAEGRKALES